MTSVVIRCRSLKKHYLQKVGHGFWKEMLLVRLYVREGRLLYSRHLQISHLNCPSRRDVWSNTWSTLLSVHLQWKLCSNATFLQKVWRLPPVKETYWCVSERGSAKMTGYPLTSPCSTLPNMAVSPGSQGVLVRSPALTPDRELHMELKWTRAPPASNPANRRTGRWAGDVLDPENNFTSDGPEGQQGATRRNAEPQRDGLAGHREQSFQLSSATCMRIDPKMCDRSYSAVKGRSRAASSDKNTWQEDRCGNLWSESCQGFLGHSHGGASGCVCVYVCGGGQQQRWWIFLFWYSPTNKFWETHWKTVYMCVCVLEQRAWGFHLRYASRRLRNVFLVVFFSANSQRCRSDWHIFS